VIYIAGQWLNYGGARGGLAHLKDLAAPSKHLFWEGSRGPVKGPWNCKMITHYLYMLYCNLQVFLSWNCRTTFWSPEMWFLGFLKIFSMLAIAHHILGPLINYAVIRPL